jgi:hypothetical protein
MKIKQITHTISKSKYGTLLIVGAIALTVGGGITAVIMTNKTNDTVISQAQTNGANQDGVAIDDTSHVVTPLPANLASNNTTTAAQLIYLIEEEKLAHDVYQKMSELWGVRVFSNIQRSEVNHQTQLLAVMQSRGIADPRSSQVGVFTDQKLQTLYDQLVAQGSQSAAEAYKVGIAIEELDISDIKTDLASLDAKDTDVKATMENLLRGSENHLSAFSRQSQR